MARKPVPKRDDPEQSKRFIEAAKAVATDEDQKAFERAFKKVTAHGVVPRARPKGSATK